MNRIASALLLLLLITSAFGADRPLATVSLQLDDSRVLPGVPFTLIARYKNISGQPVAVGTRGTVIITPAGGTPFRMPREAEVDDFYLRPIFVLQPGEEEIGTIQWDSNWLFDDAAFAGPGRYDISLEVRGAGEDPDEGVLAAGPILSSTVRLTRIDPQGEDAEVWQRLQASAGGHWPSHGFASTFDREQVTAEVIANHRNSGYYPYALLLRAAWNGQYDLSKMRDAVERFHGSPAYPYLLVAAGIAANSEAEKTERRGASLKEVEGKFKLAQFYNAEALSTGSLAVKVHAAQDKRGADDALERIREKRARLK